MMISSSNKFEVRPLVVEVMDGHGCHLGNLVLCHSREITSEYDSAIADDLEFELLGFWPAHGHRTDL